MNIGTIGETTKNSLGSTSGVLAHHDTNSKNYQLEYDGRLSILLRICKNNR